MKRYPSLASGAAVLIATTLTAGFPHRAQLSAAAFQREHGQGDQHRDDPCDQLPDPPGQANGIDRICAAGGSSSGIAKGDFNGDGFADLAAGVPGEDTPNDVSNSGAVNVIYGSGGGLTTSTTVVPAVPAPQFWSQNATGVPGISEAGDAFGSALAAGDFNGDGYSDLAIGIPGDDVDGEDAGAVIVIYGSRNGLTATDPSVPAARFLDLRSATSPYGDLRFLRAGARLGSSLTWGDFNGDGVGDLAMGAPRADVGVSCYPYVCDVADEAGLVWVLSGRTDSGLNLVSNSVCFGLVEYVGFDVKLLSGNQFGKVLTSGDFDRDGFFDLVVGAPTSAGLLGPGRNAGRNGRVTVIFASSVGPNCDGYLDLIAGPEDGDQFGYALAAGDFNGDGWTDLAVGAPGRSKQSGIGWVFDMGAVEIYQVDEYYCSGQLCHMETWEQDDIFSQESESGDQFGTALAAGDFNGDGRADLAIGVPLEDVVVNGVSIADAGEVDIIYGEASGLSRSAYTRTEVWHQGSADAKHGEIIGDPGWGDRFGASLTAWNFGRNEFDQVGPGVFVVRRSADLAIGVPYEDVSGVKGAGGVNVIYGTFIGGLEPTGNQFWSQGSARVPGGVESGDHFGASVY
jgi:hypothetical protein